MYARMQERLLRIPGVGNAAFSLYAPMSGDNWSANVVVEGHDTSERVTASWNRVSAALLRHRRDAAPPGPGVRRARPRGIAARRSCHPVASPGSSSATPMPIGRRIGQSVPEIEIVGVVGDAKYQDGRRAPREMFFLPYLQETSDSRARAVAMGVKLDRSHYPQAIEIHADARRARSGTGSPARAGRRRSPHHRPLDALDGRAGRGRVQPRAPDCAAHGRVRRSSRCCSRAWDSTA